MLWHMLDVETVAGCESCIVVFQKVDFFRRIFSHPRIPRNCSKHADSHVTVHLIRLSLPRAGGRPVKTWFALARVDAACYEQKKLLVNRSRQRQLEVV